MKQFIKIIVLSVFVTVNFSNAAYEYLEDLPDCPVDQGDSAVLDYLKELIEKNPENADYHVKLGLFFIDQQDGVSAKYTLLKALSIDPDHEEALLHYVRLLNRGVHYSEAYGKVKGLDGKLQQHPLIKMEWIESCIALGRTAEALTLCKEYTEAEIRAELTPQIIKSRCIWLLSMDEQEEYARWKNCLDKDSVESLILEARSMMKENKPDSAIENLNLAETKNKGLAEIQLLRAEIQVLKGDYTEAINILEDVDVQSVYGLQAKKTLFDWYLKFNQKEDALNLVANLEGHSSFVHAGYLGRLLGATLNFTDGYYTKAAYTAKRIAFDFPENLEANLLAARCDLMLRRFVDAHATLDEVLKRNSAYLPALMLKASVFLNEQKYEEAKSTLEAQRDSQNVELLHQYALITYILGEPDKAMKLWEEVLTLQPSHVTAANNLATLYADRGVNLDKAEMLVADFIKLSPGDAVLSDTYGWVLFKQGKLEEAIKHLSYSYFKAPHSADSNYHYGVVLVASGKEEQGLSLIQKALKMSPEALWTQKALNIIEENKPLKR